MKLVRLFFHFTALVQRSRDVTESTPFANDWIDSRSIDHDKHGAGGLSLTKLVLLRAEYVHTRRPAIR